MAVEIFIVSLIAGIVFLGVELFIPGGVLGVIGVALLILSIVYAFIAFPAAGPYVATGVLALIALAFFWWTTVFPHTRPGRRLMAGASLKGSTSVEQGLDSLRGKQGVAASPLRPSGYVLIDGRRIDVVTRGEMIEKDCPVRVVDVEGSRVIVAQVLSQTQPAIAAS